MVIVINNNNNNNTDRVTDLRPRGTMTIDPSRYFFIIGASRTRLYYMHTNLDMCAAKNENDFDRIS